jgi:hypothetical protein
MATQLANGDRDRLNEVFGSFIDETIGIVARQTRDTAEKNRIAALKAQTARKGGVGGDRRPPR